MRLETQCVEDKESLREIQKALKRGNATNVLGLYTDTTLVQLLRRMQRPFEIISWIHTVALFVLALLYTGMLFHVWRLTPAPIMFFLVAFRLVRFFKIKPEVLEAVKPRLESASLPTLLDAYVLHITELKETLQKAISKRLALAATEDLELLSPIQRKQLVRFTLAQLRMDLTNYNIGKPYFLSDDCAQAATVGFLALASLNQPGAERVSPQRVQTTNANLRRAIEEYKLARESAG